MEIRQSAVTASETCAYSLALYLDGVKGRDKTEMQNGRVKHAELETQVKAGHTSTFLAAIMEAWGIPLPESERQYRTEMGGITFTGTVDLSHSTARVLYIMDYKFPVSEYNVRYYEKKRLQLMIYAYLEAMEKGLSPDTVKACFIFPDYCTAEATRWIPFEFTWAEVKATVEAKFERIIGLIASGVFPTNNLACKTCLYNEACPKYAEQCTDLALPSPADITAQTAGEVYRRIMLIESLTEQAKRAKDRLKELIASGELAREFSSGDNIIRASERKGKRRLDTKKLLADHPEIDASQYESEGEPYTVFSVTKIPEVL